MIQFNGELTKSGLLTSANQKQSLEEKEGRWALKIIK